MFTAKIQRTEQTHTGLDIYVDFYNDGVFSHTENVVPQDKTGFFYWKESRLKSLNTKEVLKTELSVGQDITAFSDEVVVELTPAELARKTWLEKYSRWVRVKETLIDTGVILATNPRAQSLLADVKATLEPEYLDFI
jgi:hypothetical protein